MHNTFGIWRVTASVDGVPYFEYRMDGFTHDLSRCCDAVSCYSLQPASRNEVIRLARLAGSPGCFYPVMEERGVVRTAEGQLRRIRIEAEDDCGNRSALEFTVRGRSESFRAEADTAAVALYPDRTSLVQVGREARASIPEGALYEPIFVKPERRETPQADSGVVVLSPAYRFLSPDTPLRHPATGDLVAVADTLAPAVRPLFAEGADLSKSESLRFRAADNFSGIASWTLRIDGEWVPCDRFPVKGTLVHFFDAPPQRRRHDVQLSVRDGCGNTAHFKGTFYR